jgi:Transposase DDE domain
VAKDTKPCPPVSTLLAGDLPRQLHRALAWALDSRLFATIKTHGNTRWQAPDLILLTILWVWSDCSTLTKAFNHACQLCQRLLGKIVLNSYTGFCDALTTWTPTLIPLLWKQLHQHMEKIAGSYWRIGLWMVLAVDGSRTTTPRTRKNEHAFCPRKYGHGKRARSRSKWKNKKRRSKKLSHAVHPQIWLTLLWHVCLRMPWAWKCGPSNACERHHFVDLIKTQKFPDKTLFCGDAGFVGYDVWNTLIEHGHHFLIRVGGNIRLLRGLGDARVYGDIVHFWPKKAFQTKQPPLVLRLMKFQVGRCKIVALTNVLDEQQLTAAQAERIYKARWGVEVQFRTLKQTFGRSKLYSRTPERAYQELEWSLIGLWLIELLTVSEQIPAGIGPEQSSPSVAIQIIQDAMSRGRPKSLRQELRGAVKDTYQRKSKKAARYRPKSKDKPATGKPKIVYASAKYRHKYRQLFGQRKSLTA